MSRIAGKLTFQDGLKRYNSEKPLRLTVIGTGPAAVSAALETRKMEIPVQIFGRREHYRAEFEAADVFITYCLSHPNQLNLFSNF